MSKAKILPLNFGGRSKVVKRPYDCEILRSKRKTLALYIKQQKVVVRCPLRASRSEVEEFISSNHAWIEGRLVEESLREKQALRIERGGKIFYRARERSIVFKEERAGVAKIVSFYAKRARGMMARFLVQHQIDQPEGLKDFAEDGYVFRPALSDASSYVFTRLQD